MAVSILLVELWALASFRLRLLSRPPSKSLQIPLSSGQIVPSYGRKMTFVGCVSPDKKAHYRPNRTNVLAPFVPVLRGEGPGMRGGIYYSNATNRNVLTSLTTAPAASNKIAASSSYSEHHPPSSPYPLPD